MIKKKVANESEKEGDFSINTKNAQEVLIYVSNIVKNMALKIMYYVNNLHIITNNKRYFPESNSILGLNRKDTLRGLNIDLRRSEIVKSWQEKDYNAYNISRMYITMLQQGSALKNLAKQFDKEFETQYFDQISNDLDAYINNRVNARMKQDVSNDGKKFHNYMNEINMTAETNEFDIQDEQGEQPTTMIYE